MKRTVRNPIVPGSYPDPSICRVGDDYGLVNSSFEFFPALPVHHSRDLVHGHCVGNVVDRPECLDLSGVRVAIEPLNRYETNFNNTVADVLELLEKVRNSAPCILLDTFHMNIEESSMARAIASAGSAHTCHGSMAMQSGTITGPVLSRRATYWGSTATG